MLLHFNGMQPSYHLIFLTIYLLQLHQLHCNSIVRSLQLHFGVCIALWRKASAMRKTHMAILMQSLILYSLFPKGSRYVDQRLWENFCNPNSKFLQTNPQYPSRPIVEVGAAPHGQNISIGSLGELHGARGSTLSNILFFFQSSP